jgi:tetratricopeptide (TPR) repeat protein
MASLIHGCEYDIFISYRQKDNKYDGWVTEFVDHLKAELESTFKEEVSVYFDINPHDGLLETHDVDASLKDKLKCLIFIPIISRTYCDPKSFAWEHELKAFVELASQDQFGLKVKLPNGNVASRILPIRIHDLDAEDIKECESVMGGFLRGIEFIYKEPGVDKPLAPDDDERKNLNHTKFRIQIIKVAHAIKEIFQGMKAEPVAVVKEKPLQKKPLEVVKKEERKEIQEKPVKISKKKLLAGTIVMALLLVIAGILVYPKIFKRDTLDKRRLSGERISVAVMPFQNMTNDTLWNVWQEGIQDILTSYLSNYSEELKVRQKEAINNLIQSKGLTQYASMTSSFVSDISQKLDADVFIYGSIKQAGPEIRLSAQLIDSKTEETIKSFEVNGPAQEEFIFQVTDSLKRMILNFLVISKLKKEIGSYLSIFEINTTNSAEAFRNYILAEKSRNNLDFSTAIEYYSQALAVDSDFISIYYLLSLAYYNYGNYDQAKKWCLSVFTKMDQLPLQYKIYANWVHALCFETPLECIKYLRQFQQIDDQSPGPYWSIGNLYNRLYQYVEAIPELEKSLEIYQKLNSKPKWVRNYVSLGLAYHRTGQIRKEKKLYKKAEEYFPKDPALIFRQVVLSLSEGDISKSNQLIEEYKSICKGNSLSEAAIATNMAGIYSEAGIPDKAEEYYRRALTLEPENPLRINNLAYVLIDNDRNINEGLNLVNKVLEKNPDNYSYLDTKGYGLYKQGKYQEALEILQKSWDLRMQQAVYSHPAYLHLEAAKKAIAGLN